jgi:hypothetical protein
VSETHTDRKGERVKCVPSVRVLCMVARQRLDNSGRSEGEQARPESRAKARTPPKAPVAGPARSRSPNSYPYNFLETR